MTELLALLPVLFTFGQEVTTLIEKLVKENRDPTQEELAVIDKHSVILNDQWAALAPR